MMSLKMVEATLPPGFRFHPRDDELVCDYLMKVVTGCDQPPLLIVVDLNKSEPWEIPETACVGGKEFYFYSQRDRKYATGLRTNRATSSGYWKATGKDRTIIRKGTLVGMRKTLVFYQGRAPKGKKTDWVMHEFRLEGPLGPSKTSSPKEDWVLCRVFLKNRDLAAKQGMEYDEENSYPSSSLPPLMEPYFTVDQTRTDLEDQNHQQVPCFSNMFTTDHQSHHHHYQPPFSYLTSMEEIPNFPNFHGGIMPQPDDFGSSYINPTTSATTTTTSSSSCHEQKFLKTVLNQITKMERGESPSFREASTCDSFLSEVTLSTMWNDQY